MIANPKPGTTVRLHYSLKWRTVPLINTAQMHGKIGIVVAASKSKPRNHGIMVDGVLHSIPCGNLQYHSEQKAHNV